MELKIYDKQGIVKMTVSPDNSSQWNHEVGVENVVTVIFTTWEFLVLEVGWYILVEGQRFSIKSEYRPKHIHDTKYTYNLKFYGREHDAQDILFCRLNQGEDDLESVFAYDGTPMDFLQKVVANMNRNTDGVVWKAGEAISANRQTINFNGLYCWDALGEIARAFGTEWWMDGEYLNISKCERGESVSLGYGQGLKSGLTQNENTNAVKWFTRLIPVGSSKNIDKSKYGYATLQLPGREKYIGINTQYGLKEYREEAAFSEIYPHRVGAISSVRSEERTNEETGNYTVYYVKDSSLPFNPDEYMIGGEVIHMTFNSGALAGKDFEVNWNNETKEFEIINQYPDENTQLPGGNLVPSADDTYVLWNISMPDEYIRAAEQELKTAVDVYLAEYSKDIYVYSGSTDYIYISKNDVPLLLGQRVRLLSEVYFGNIGRDSRITRVSRKLNNLNEATIDCSDAIASSWKSSVDSSLNQLQFSVAKELAQTVIDILKTGESGTPTDYNVLSALRSIKTFLRKDKDDRSVGKIVSDKGFEAGDYVKGFLGGSGAWIGADGYGEMSGMTLREFLEVPELRFNRIDVVSGELWNSVAFGLIEEVEETSENKGIIKIKLEENERCGLHVGDYCRGIFADFGNGSNWEGEDECGFLHLYGFWTSYFTPTKIIENKEGLFVCEYALKPETKQHPTKSMKFAVYGHPSDKSRQASAYATRTYKRYLNNVNTWVIDPDRHIYAQYGDLSGLKINGVEMKGYGSFQSNAYFSGVQIQLPPEQLESLKGDSAYSAHLTNNVGTVSLDKDGNIKDGLYEESVVTASDNGVQSEVTAKDGNGNESTVTVINHKLTTAVQAYKGSTPLYYSSTATSGSFTLSLTCVGCTAFVVNGAVIVSSITDTKNCLVNISVNCEGMAVYNLVYSIVFVQDGNEGEDGKKGEDAASYTIQPSNLPISLVGSTLTPYSAVFTCFKNTGQSTQSEETATWYMYRCNSGNESDYSLYEQITNYTSTYKATFDSSYRFYKIVAKPYKDVEVTAYAMVTKDGVGEDGENGYFPRDRGIFVQGEKYYYSKNQSTGEIFRDKIVYKIDGAYFNFIVKNRNDNGYVTEPPTSSTGDDNWEAMSSYRSIIADTLFGSNANIGGFMATSERLRTSAEVNGNPRFELDGSKGIQTMRQDGGTVWSVNADGVQSIGFEDGERIVLDPNDKSISVFDSNGVQRTNIDGKEYTKSELIVTSGGTFLLSSYANNTSGKSLTNSNALGSVASYSLTSVLTFRYAGVAEVNISDFYMSLYHSARAISTGTPSVIPNGKAYIYLCTYTSSSATTLVSKRLVAYRNVSDATVDGSTTTTDRLSGTFSVSVTSGYHRIEVLMEVSNGSSIGSTTVTAYWSLSSAKIVVESYMSRLFANGMMLSKSSDEYFMAMMDGDQMNVEAVTGSSGIRLNNGKIQLKYNNSGWFNMPITLLFARVTVSSGATSGASISYNSYDGSTVSVSSSTEGIFNITIPSSWGVTASNTNIQATAFYRYRGNSTNAVCWAVVNSVSSTSIQVITSYNNNNEFDHSGFYLEVKKFQ